MSRPERQRPGTNRKAMRSEDDSEKLSQHYRVRHYWPEQCSSDRNKEGAPVLIWGNPDEGCCHKRGLVTITLVRIRQRRVVDDPNTVPVAAASPDWLNNMAADAVDTITQMHSAALSELETIAPGTGGSSIPVVVASPVVTAGTLDHAAAPMAAEWPNQLADAP